MSGRNRNRVGSAHKFCCEKWCKAFKCSKQTRSSSSWVKMWVQFCLLLGLLKGLGVNSFVLSILSAGSSSMAYHHPDLANWTLHQSVGQTEIGNRSKSRSLYKTQRQAGRFGRSARHQLHWLPKWPAFSQKIKGWSKSQGQSPARMEVSFKETKQEAKDQQEVQKAKGPHFFYACTRQEADGRLRSVVLVNLFNQLLFGCGGSFGDRQQGSLTLQALKDGGVVLARNAIQLAECRTVCSRCRLETQQLTR